MPEHDYVDGAEVVKTYPMGENLNKSSLPQAFLITDKVMRDFGNYCL
jgi:hypothetical protein